MGYFLLRESMLDSVLVARDRWGLLRQQQQLLESSAKCKMQAAARWRISDCRWMPCKLQAQVVSR